jgi:hypothetical protein
MRYLIDAQGYQYRFTAHSCCGERGLTAGVSPAYHQYVALQMSTSNILSCYYYNPCNQTVERHTVEVVLDIIIENVRTI